MLPDIDHATPSDYEREAARLLKLLPDDINQACILIGFILVGMYRGAKDPSKFDDFCDIVRRGIRDERVS